MVGIILILFAGFFVGLLVKGRIKLPTSTLTMISICLLLFVMGLEIGGNDALLSNLPSMGVTAFAVTVMSMISCSVLVWAFCKLFKKESNEK